MNSSSQTTRASTPSTSDDQTRQQRSSGSATTRPSRTSSAAASAPTSSWWNQQTMHFSVNAWVFVVAFLAVFPLVPRSISNSAYMLALIGTACSSLYSLYALYGKPREWNLQALQVWFQSVIATKDFIYFVYCLPVITSQLTLKSALLPVLCRSLEHVAKFLRCNYSHSSLYRKYMEELCMWVESNTPTLGLLSSQAEIGIGFLLIISLVSSVTNSSLISDCNIFLNPIFHSFSFTKLSGLINVPCRCQRNIIQTFIYWQLLKLMYHVPVTGGYHRSVWATIRKIVVPFVHRYVPFLDMPISAVQKWWLR